MNHWDVFVPVSFCKLLNEPAERMGKKTLEEDFQAILHSIACLFTQYWHVVSKIEKTGPKNQTKISADFPFFFQFPFMATLSHWYKDWVQVAKTCFEAC